MEHASSPPSRAAYWQGHIERWQQSGDTQQGYCREHELSYARFQYWRRKLREEGDQARAHTQRSGFVAVTPDVNGRSPALSVVLPNGVQLRGVGADNLALVERLLERWS